MISHQSTCADLLRSHRGSAAPDTSLRYKRLRSQWGPAAQPSSSPPSTPKGPACEPRDQTDRELPGTGACCMGKQKVFFFFFLLKAESHIQSWKQYGLHVTQIYSHNREEE